MRVLLTLIVLLGSSCWTEILGVVVPNAECQTPVDGALVDEGVLDVGPTPALANSYEGVVLVQGSANARITEASVSFQDERSDPLPTEVDGVSLSLPHVEDGERVDSVDGTLGDDGRGTFSFTLVTRAEAEQLQLLTRVGDELHIIVELQVLADVTTAEPFFFPLRLCKQCLVGVGANVEDDELVCPDGSPPTATDPAPCQRGRDDVWSACAE